MNPAIEWCNTCGREEVFVPSEHLTRCKSCGHVYKTEGDLAQADVELRLTSVGLDESGEVWPRRAIEIDLCPMCVSFMS